MKARTWRVIVLAGIVFFAVQLVSSLLLFPLGGVFRSAAIALRPLDGELRLEAARIKLAGPEEKWAMERMRPALVCLDSAVSRNPLDYRLYYDRARILLRMEALGEETSQDAAEAMRRTLSLRWKNPQIGIAGMRFALARWPLLENGEQQFYRDLFSRLVTVIRDEEMDLILETWARYSRDRELLEAGLEMRPQFFRNGARILESRQIHMSERLRFLARYEVWSLDNARRMLKQAAREGRDNFSTWKHVAHHLPQGVSGYSRMVDDIQFDFQGYRELMDDLQIRMLTGLTGSMEWTRRPASRKEIIELANQMLKRPAAQASLRGMAQRLESTRFFATFDKNLEVLELRMRLLLGAGEANSAVLIGAKAVEERHYVPPDEVDAVRRIFLLYAEALRQLKKIVEAMSVIDIARERVGGDESLEWMAYRLKNPGEIVAESEDWQNLPQSIRESFRVTLKRGATVHTVYPSPGNEVVIGVPLDAAKILGNVKLVQVWLNGWIFTEKYAGDLEPGQEWRLPLPDNPDKEPLRVEVKIR